MATAPESFLFAGLHFDRAKFGRDIGKFQRKADNETEGAPASSLLTNLDFFGGAQDAGTSVEVDKLATNSSASDEVPQRKRLHREMRNVSSTEGFDKLLSKKRKKQVANGKDPDLEPGGIPIFKGKKVIEKSKLGEREQRKLDSAKIEAAAILRKKFKIHVSGQSVPAPLEGFEDLLTKLGCKRYLLRNVVGAGYTEPTPIQRQAIPTLASGRECFACAPTGSGKTMAFLIPILMSLQAPSKEGIRAVILCPTRELALQTARELKKLIKRTKLRGRVLTKAAASCIDFSTTPCDLLITTPLRLNHVLKEGKVDLGRVQHLVLDEADKLFEMGFVEQIDEVIAACSNPKVVRSLFSATLPENVEELARSVMQDPVRIVIGERNAAAQTVEQKLMFVGSEEGKLLAVRQMFQEGLQPPVLMFVQSKERAKQLYKELSFDGVKVDVIHADRTQAQREAVVESFRAGRTWVLIATDVMARGMDFKGVACVVNYDFPQSTASYVHRIGRSGRAGRPGKAITLYTESDSPSLRSIANVITASGSEVPPWMLSLPKHRKRGNEKTRVLRRKDISTLPKIDIQKKKRKSEMIEASKRRKQMALQAGGPIPPSSE